MSVVALAEALADLCDNLGLGQVDLVGCELRDRRLRRFVTDLSCSLADVGTFDSHAFMLPRTRRTQSTGRPERRLGYGFLPIPQ
jgi:hypothetical protein